jgi:hypothetical protein
MPPDIIFFWWLTILTSHFNTPKLVWIIRILCKTAVSDRCWESKIEGSGFKSCRPLVVKLFLSKWIDKYDFIDFLVHRYSRHASNLLIDSNRLEKSMIKIYTKNGWLKWLYTKIGWCTKKIVFGPYSEAETSKRFEKFFMRPPKPKKYTQWFSNFFDSRHKKPLRFGRGSI